MLNKVISNITKNKEKKAGVDFFDLSLNEREAIIKRAAQLSGQDQNKLLKEYQNKFGELVTSSCK